MRIELAVLALVGAFSCTGTDAALYKWVDDQGRVQYSDKPPARDKAGVEMSNRGIVRKKIEPGPTPEDLKAREEELARQRAEEEKAAEQRRMDHALLQAYTTADEIDLKRDREVQALKASIDNLRTQSTSLAERIAEDKASAENYTRQGKTPPAPLTDALARQEADKRVLDGEIARKERDMAAARSHYEAQRKRYLELKSASKETQRR